MRPLASGRIDTLETWWIRSRRRPSVSIMLLLSWLDAAGHRRSLAMDWNALTSSRCEQKAVIGAS